MGEELKNNLVSIVIPVYNAAPYLEETIESVKSQTYHNWELILIDDASTDNSLEILQRHKRENVTVLSLLENKGPAVARNAGICIAKGRYLAFLDADDIWDTRKLEKQIKFIKEKDCAFSFTGYEFADKTGKRNGKVVYVPEQISYQEALKNTTISTITVLFDRTKIPTEFLWMPEDCPREDTATWWRILRNGYTAYGLNEALSVYRRHSGSHSANKVKAVIGTYQMYRKQEQLGRIISLWYLFLNLCKAVKRRV